MPNFTVQCFQNEYLAQGAEDVNAIVTVRATGLPAVGPDDASGPSAAVVLLIDVSGSMNGPKIRQARKATIAAINCVRDGVRFAVIAGNQVAVQVWPSRGMAAASEDERHRAYSAVERLQAGGGTRIGTWLDAATELLGGERGVRQAILLTDGKNENETPEDLAAALGRASGVFQCECRGVGTDWDRIELQGIANALLGSVDIVANPSDLTMEFESVMSGTMQKQAPDVVLRVWVPQGAKVLSLKQMATHITDLTGTGFPSDALATDYPTGSWGDEERDYHLLVRVNPGAIGDEMLAARITVIQDGERVGQGLVKAIWTDDLKLSTKLNRRVAEVTGEEELADAIDEGMQALNDGDAHTAAVKLGRAVQLADEAGDHEKSEMLAKVVDVEPSTGRVRLKANIAKADAMTLETRSRKTKRFRK